MEEQLLTRLEEMGAEVEDSIDRLMGDEEMYLDYLHRLPDNKNIVELRKAVQAGDADKAMREAHTLKGVALNLGLVPLADLCMDMLVEFHAGNPEQAMAMLGTVEENFRQWSDVIRG